MFRQTGGGCDPDYELGSVLLRIMHWALCLTEKSLLQLPSNDIKMRPLLKDACDAITSTWESGVTSSLIIIAKAEDEGTLEQLSLQILSFNSV